jgi:AcrR family transcriptional regulator
MSSTARDAPRTRQATPASAPVHAASSSVAAEAHAPRRRDAQRNRQTFLAIALDAFAEHGADASLEQIARDAGLAIGTLYRHFPTRMDLLLAVFEPRACELLREAEIALAMDDPWEGFGHCLDALFSMQAGNRGFNDFICTRFPGDVRTESLHNRLCELMKQVVRRAQDSGDVRTDITDADIVSLIWANGGIIEATRHVAPLAWRRNLYLMMDAFRSSNRHELPEPPLTDAQLYESMAYRGSC